MIWPNSLVTCSMYSTLHRTTGDDGSLRFFMLVFACALADLRIERPSLTPTVFLHAVQPSATRSGHSGRAPSCLTQRRKLTSLASRRAHCTHLSSFCPAGLRRRSTRSRSSAWPPRPSRPASSDQVTMASVSSTFRSIGVRSERADRCSRPRGRWLAISAAWRRCSGSSRQSSGAPMQSRLLSEPSSDHTFPSACAPHARFADIWDAQSFASPVTAGLFNSAHEKCVLAACEALTPC
jgi:hypothetical protein